MGPSVPTARLVIPFTAEKWENISFIFDIPDGAPRQAWPRRPGRGRVYSNVRVNIVAAVTASPLLSPSARCLQTAPDVSSLQVLVTSMYCVLSPCPVKRMSQILFFREPKNVRNIKDGKKCFDWNLKIVICYQAAAINHPGQRTSTNLRPESGQLWNLQFQCL